MKHADADSVRSGGRILLVLKMRGPQTAAELGVALGFTDEAARQHLVKLTSEGLVVGTSEVRGVGRPKQVWNLSEASRGRFPDAHADLTVQLIETIREVLGEDALDRLISAREQDVLKRYRQELRSANDLEERLQRLTAIRDREGYMCELKKDSGDFLLVENHCPICAAAATCQGFCSAELRTFQKVLGRKARVTREEHIISGARRCTYRIEENE